MYIFGGFPEQPSEFDSALIMFNFESMDVEYSFDNRIWTNVCVGLVTVVYNGFIYIFGGYNKVGHFNGIDRYDPVGCLWKKILPKGKPPFFSRIQICQVVNDRVFITGVKSPRMSNFLVCRHQEHVPKVPMVLKHHDDFHVLDMNPSLKDMYMVNVWERLIELNVDHTDDLSIPLSLKRELDIFNPIKLLENDDN